MPHALYLLRHAHALPAADGDLDIDRALSEAGLAQCAKLAVLVKDMNFDKVFCSPARRTVETLRNVVNKPLVEMREGFYNATQAALLRAVQAAEEDFASVLVVAHNPGICELGRALGLGAKTFPPCAFASFSLTGPWKDTSAATCAISDFYCP